MSKNIYVWILSPSPTSAEFIERVTAPAGFYHTGDGESALGAALVAAGNIVPGKREPGILSPHPKSVFSFYGPHSRLEQLNSLLEGTPYALKEDIFPKERMRACIVHGPPGGKDTLDALLEGTGYVVTTSAAGEASDFKIGRRLVPKGNAEYLIMTRNSDVRGFTKLLPPGYRIESEFS